jgi:cardiolipin synthase (CMP-forming)
MALHSSQMPRWINIPNLFTALRLALVPFVVVAIVEGRHLEAFALFSVAALTDFLDGAAARRLGVATPAGAYLDPIADKCLLSGVFLALAWSGELPWWLVAVVFGRDLFILLGAAAFLLLTPVRKFPPSIWGKLSTCVQIATVVAWMGRNLMQSPPGSTASWLMLWPCAGFTIWSGIDYARRGFSTFRSIDGFRVRE